MKSTADVDFALCSVEEVWVFIEDIILSLFQKATGAHKFSFGNAHRLGNSIRFRCAKEMRFKYVVERMSDTVGEKRFKLFQASAAVSTILYLMYYMVVALA